MGGWYGPWLLSVEAWVATVPVWIVKCELVHGADAKQADWRELQTGGPSSPMLTMSRAAVSFVQFHPAHGCAAGEPRPRLGCPLQTLRVSLVLVEGWLW